MYTPPRLDLLDEAARHGLRVMVGLPWSQHVAFLDDRKLDARRSAATSSGRSARSATTRRCSCSRSATRFLPASSAGTGDVRVEHFLRRPVPSRRKTPRRKRSSPTSTFRRPSFSISRSSTSAPSTSICIASPSCAPTSRGCSTSPATSRCCWPKRAPTRIREGEDGQADITAMHIRAAFEEGACGAIAFAWTDEWWRGGHRRRRLGVRPRRSRSPAETGRGRRGPGVCRRAIFPSRPGRPGPASRSSSARTTRPTRSKTTSRRSTGSPIPTTKSSLVNDGSRDATGDIARRHARVRVDRHSRTRGLSAARNVGLAEATGEIVAYTDADTRVDRDWLTFLVQPFLNSDVVGSGGPNVVPNDDPPIAQCIARAPGGPTHVLLDDRIAEHVPGCNMAFRRDALLAIGGFNPDLPARRRRCRRLLAAAGARLENRIRSSGARLASPSLVGRRRTGGSRSATAKAKRG